MKHIALIAALFACTAPALADTKRAAPAQPPALDLAANAAKPRAKDGLDRMDDLVVKRCNDAGGGMMTTNEGTYRCVGPDGQDIPHY
jgi:hypothetical protein